MKTSTRMVPPLPVTFLLMIVVESTSLQQHTGKTSVSISPSGEIVEGSSVTLTCSSDASSPVENYIWYKTDGHYEGPRKGHKMKIIGHGTGQTYEIRDVNSGHSGGYRCLPLPGGSESDMVLLNVFYAPRNVLVSISPSGDIVEGSSVTLTCSSDANPPVKIYTWFKEGGTSPVGFGHSYSIINVTIDGKGGFYCEAQNSIGTQKSPVVSILEPGHLINMKYVVIGSTACGGLFLFVLLWICFRCKQKGGRNKDINSHNPSRATAVDASLDPGNQDGILCNSVSPQAPLNAQTSVSRTGDHVECASVKFHNTDGTKKSGNDIIYASVQFHHSALCSQLEKGTAEDSSVIYSSVKQHN